MSYYFAYGMNMDPEHMARLCPGMEPLGTGCLEGFRFAINRRGFATFLPDPGAAVHGVIWRLVPVHESRLDRFEGVDEGLYWRDFVPIRLAEGSLRQALTYRATDPEPGRPDPEYLEQIVRGARAFGLPETYLEELIRWRP